MSDDTKFCNNCGNSLADVTPTQPGNSDNAGPQQSGSPFPMPVISSAAGDQQGQGMPQNSTNNMNSMNQSGMDQNSMGQQPQPGMNPLFSAPPVEAPEKKKNPFPFIVIGVAACFIVVIAVVLCLVLGGGYKKPVTKLVGLVNSKSTNVSAYMECITPPFVPETYKEALGLLKGGDAKDELNDTINDAFDEAFDGIEDQFGKNWKVSVEWKKNKKLSDKEIEKLQKAYDSLSKTLDSIKIDDEDTWEDIADAIDDEFDTEINTSKAAKMGENLMKKLDNFKITDGYEIKVKVNIEGKDDKDSQTMSANVIKANGKWFIDPLSFSEGGVSASSLMNMVDDLDFD